MVVEKVVKACRFVIPAWLHSSGVDGGNPSLRLTAGNYGDVLDPRFRIAALK